MRDLMRPRQPICDTLLANFAHPQAQCWIGHEFSNALRKVELVIRSGIDGCILRRYTVLWKIERDDRPPQSHVFRHLDHRRLVVE